MFRSRMITGGVAASCIALNHRLLSTSCAAPSVITSNSVTRPKPAVQPMDMKGKVVLITGATAGIGLACAWRFAEHGSNLVLVGRRAERLKNIKELLKKDFPHVKVHTVAMSVSDTDAVAKLPKELPKDFQDVAVLVNNAGLALGVSAVQDNKLEDTKTVMDTNVIGTVAFCSAFLPGMIARNSGHVINVGSCAGHIPYAMGSVYNASKFAVLGFTSAARHDLVSTPVRVTHISPGIVGNTEFSNVRMGGDDSKAKTVYNDVVPLTPEDCADNVIYAATRPPHVQISEIIMYATNQSGPKEISRVGPSLGAK